MKLVQKYSLFIIDLFESYLLKNNKHNYGKINTRNIKTGSE